MADIINNKIELNLLDTKKETSQFSFNSKVDFSQTDNYDVIDTLSEENNQIEEYNVDGETQNSQQIEQLTQLNNILTSAIEDIKKEIESAKTPSSQQYDRPSASISTNGSNIVNSKLDSLNEQLAILKTYQEQVQRQLDLAPYTEIVNSNDYQDFISNWNCDNIGIDYNSFGVNYDIDIYAAEHAMSTDEIDAYAVFEHLYTNRPEGTDIEYAKAMWLGNSSVEVSENFYFMTEEQLNIYHYLFQKEGKSSAEEYLSLIQDDINKASGTYYASNFIDSLDLNDEEKLEESLSNYFKTSGKGLMDGIGTFFNGINNAIVNNESLTASDYEKIIILNYLQENSNLLDETYEFSSALGNMVPAMAASTMVSFIGTPAAGAKTASALMGLSAYGNAKHQALVKGNDLASSTLYGILVGTSEATLGYFLGRIPGISKNSGLTIKNLLMEGSEEFSQEWLDAGFRTVVLGENVNWSEIPEDAMKSFVMGVLMVGLTNGGQNIVNLTINGEQLSINIEETLKYIENNPGVDIVDAFMRTNETINLEQAVSVKNINRINVTDLDMSFSKFSKNINLNLTYQNYDFLYKSNDNLEDTLYDIQTNENQVKTLIEIDNSTQITNEFLSQLPDNVDVRIVGGNTDSYLNAFKHSPQESTNATTSHCTYSSNELKQIMAKIYEFEQGINPSWNETEKARYAYEYLRDNIKYNANPGSNVSRAKEYDGLWGLVKGESTCQGYAQIYKELCDRMGIKCTTIAGSLNGEGQHAYTIITADNETFIVDPVREFLSESIRANGFNVSDIEAYSAVSQLPIEYIIKNLNADNLFTYLSMTNGRYGIDQGIFTNLETTDPTMYSYMKNKIINEYGFSARDADRFMKIVDSIGACNYAAEVNVIATYFKDKPSEFEKLFGFPLFKQNAQGQYYLNDAELLADLYYWGNSNSKDAELFIKTVDGGTTFNENAIIKREDGGLTVRQRGSSLDPDTINEYLSSKNTNIICDGESLRGNSPEKTTNEELFNFISQAMESGNIISLSCGPLSTEPITFKDVNNNELIPFYGGHHVQVTDVTSEGLIVTSWGRKCLVTIDDLQNNASWKIASFTFQ